MGAFYQLLQERKLRREEPERFPAGPLESFALSYRGWRRGLWTIIPRSNHHHEQVRQRALSKKGAMETKEKGAVAEMAEVSQAAQGDAPRSLVNTIARAVG